MVNEILKVMFLNSTEIDENGNLVVLDVTTRDWNFYNGMCEVISVLGLDCSQTKEGLAQLNIPSDIVDTSKSDDMSNSPVMMYETPVVEIKDEGEKE